MHEILRQFNQQHGKNIQVHKADIYMLDNTSEEVSVSHLIQVFHLNIRDKCCGWPKNAGLKQTLNIMSFSSSSGHRLIRGKGIWKEEGNRGRFLLPPQHGQTAESTAVYSHLTGTADYRNIGFISH